MLDYMTQTAIKTTAVMDSLKTEIIVYYFIFTLRDTP
jgi:hypothetical protein